MGRQSLTTKQCAPCGLIKSLSEFYNYKRSKDGKSYRCKTCDDLATKKWKADNPIRSRQSARNRQKKLAYGIPHFGYELLLFGQNGRCLICGLLEKDNKIAGSTDSLSVDHCHTTMKIRGLLCNQCNRAIGMLKDDPVLLRKAAAYLESNTNGLS